MALILKQENTFSSAKRDYYYGKPCKTFNIPYMNICNYISDICNATSQKFIKIYLLRHFDNFYLFIYMYIFYHVHEQINKSEKCYVL